MSTTPGETSPEEDDPLVGRTIAGKFLVERRLGAGAMGAVYRAQQTALDRPIAIKVMHAAFAADPNYAERFHREAKAASRLDHPNLIRVYDYGQEPDGLLYIAMEFLDCRDLLGLLEEEWPLAPARMIDLLAQVLSGLAEAHAAGVLHRDLKPENIMVLRRRAEEGEIVDVVKVCDFGIAKLVEPTDGSAPGPAKRKLTTAGLVLGTPEYMSPEQARGEAYDARSDLYAVGVILYEMLTRRLPFEGKTPFEVVFKAMHQDPVALEERGPTVAPALDPICRKAIGKLPEDRYQTAREMRAALLAIDLTAVHAARPPPVATAAPAAGAVADDETTRPVPPPGEEAAATAPSPRRRRFRLSGGVGLILAGALGALAIISALPAHPARTAAAPSVPARPSPSPMGPIALTADPAAVPSSIATSDPSGSAEALPPAPSGFSARAPARRSSVAAGPSVDRPAPSVSASTDRAEVPAPLPNVAVLTPTPKLDTPAPVVAPPSPAPPPSAPASFNLATARVELGRVKSNNAAVTSNSVSRALAPLTGRFSGCYRTALSEDRTSNGEATATLHLESDDEGYVTVARVTGGAPASAARCIEAATRAVHLDVNTGTANVEIVLTFKPL